MHAFTLLTLSLVSPVSPGDDGVVVECVRVLHSFFGQAAGDQFGWVSSPIPDLDGDGILEVVITAPFHDAGGANAGRIHLVSGASGGELFHADGGRAGELLGFSARDAGDVDGDSVCDVVAGGQGSATVPGAARVYSGATGAEIVAIQLGAAGDLFGASVTGIGDVDGDGHADLAVAATRDDTAGLDAGRVYVVSGADGQTVLWTIAGERAGDLFGSSLANLGDVTGDGLPELAVGAANGGPSMRGRAYVYDVARRQLVYTVQPTMSGANFGQYFIASPGDVNGDALPDLYVSDFGDGGGRGKAYVYDGPTGALVWSRRGQAGDGFGIGRGVGDVDGDGFDDLILGSWIANDGALNAGKADIVSGLDGTILTTLTSSTAGENFGFDAHGMGDVDGDGRPDYFVTAATHPQGGAARGAAYLIAGGTPVTSIGTGVGSAGFVPRIALAGCPCVGADLVIDVVDLRAGAWGALFLGTERIDLPRFGGTLITRPDVLRRFQRSSGPVGEPGLGTASFPVKIPDDPAVAGMVLYAQALYVDLGAPRLLSFSNGLEIRVF